MDRISNKTLGQRVLDKLRAKIMDAEFLPGESISLKGISELFGVSIQPVREAVWQLEAEGIVRVKPNKGIEISQLSASDFQEILLMRINLESLALEQGCMRRSARDVSRVEKILGKMKVKINEADPKGYLQQNASFHYELYKAARMPILLETIEKLRLRVHPYIYQSVTTRRDIGMTLEDHQQIFEGFARQDGSLAVAALEKDLSEAAEFLLSRWQQDT